MIEVIVAFSVGALFGVALTSLIVMTCREETANEFDKLCDENIDDNDDVI